MDRLKRDLSDKERERNAVKERLNITKALDELKQQDAELERLIKEDHAVINDEHTSPSERAAAEERGAKREEERNRLRTQFKERERAIST